MFSNFRTWVTFLVTAAIVVSSMLPSVCGAPVSQVEQTAETKDRGDCLPNQFLSPSSLTCENCSICPQGTEHSPKGQCGNGWGVETTCTPCAEGFFQTGEGYTGLVCSRCVTCDLNVKNRQNCTPTQDARCGPCPPGKYEFLENICLECKENPSHADCLQTSEPTRSIKHPASPNHSAPTLPASIPLHVSTTPGNTTPSPLSSQAHNTSNDPDDRGTPTNKFSVYDVVIVAVVPVIAICGILLAVCGYKKWKAGNNSASENVLPSKSPATFPNAAYEDLLKDDSSMTSMNDEGSSVRSSQSEIQREAEESAAPLPGAETTAPTSAAPINEPLQGTSNPVDQTSASLALTSDVSNIELSLPGVLSVNGGRGGDEVLYQNHLNHVPGSPYLAKNNFVFGDDDNVDDADDDDDETMSVHGPLMS